MVTSIFENTCEDAPRRRKMTVEEFDCAGATGVWKPEERLELIEGEVIVKVTPQESRHSTGTRLSDIALNRIFTTGYDVRTQLPLVFGPHSKPEPDVAVVTGPARDYSRAHPTTAVLIIEVSDSTLRYDRAVKAALYALHGIADYWILNLNERVLEAHRLPAPMTDQPFGHGYRSVLRYTETDGVAPLAAPQSLISIANLLP